MKPTDNFAKSTSLLLFVKIVKELANVSSIITNIPNHWKVMTRHKHWNEIEGTEILNKTFHFPIQNNLFIL